VRLPIITFFCCAKISFLLGQWPDAYSSSLLGHLSLGFPTGVNTSFLYPETSVTYTHADGTTNDVACFIPGEAEVPKVDCPHPFVNPISATNTESCIQPCPVQAYTDSEYTLMWGVSNGIGLVAFFLNVFMAFTWMLAGKRHLSEQPFQLRFCVFAGIFYGAVATIPSLVMKYDLPCECETEEW
jgi:hypothetical protein